MTVIPTLPQQVIRLEDGRLVGPFDSEGEARAWAETYKLSIREIEPLFYKYRIEYDPPYTGYLKDI